MKISKLLNNNYLSILLIILLFNSAVVAEDKPIDIWNIDQNVTEEIDSDINQNNKAIDEKVTPSSIYNSQFKSQDIENFVSRLRKFFAENKYYFLINNHFYPDSGTYGKYLHQIACENT